MTAPGRDRHVAQPGTAAASQPGSDPVLELVDVHAGYERFLALFGVSFAVGERQSVALVGPNGAGKTTSARVASGLLEPTRGRVVVAGRDLTGQPAHRFAAAGIIHAPEGRSVFSSLTVEENLALPFRRIFGRSGVREAIDRAYEVFPRLGERRRQNAGSLSGGEQRMLSLARVLVDEPKLLIADEPSLGLAPIVIEEVYEVLQRIRDAGTALLIIEQHIDQALKLADHVVVLEHGHVSIAGRPEDLDLHRSLTLSGKTT